MAAWLIAAGPAWSQATTGSLPSDPTGEWLVAKKVARIKIADCGGQMWGVVQWEAQPGGVDRNNPDPNLRSRPTLGMPILLGMKPTKPNQWDGNSSKPNQWDGEIYNSEDGRTYSASIILVNRNLLRVRGCVLGFLCGGEDWTRYEDSSDNAQARATPPKNRRPPPNRSAANTPPEASDDVCLRLFGPTRLPH